MSDSAAKLLAIVVQRQGVQIIQIPQAPTTRWNSNRLWRAGIKITLGFPLWENDMGMQIKKLPNGLYEASATPPHVKAPWTASHPLPARELIKELQARGCHQQDIGDAMYEQDPNWVEKL